MRLMELKEKVPGEKSIYDPCPPGYRVPHPYVWSTFTSEPGGGKHKSAGFTTTIDGGIKLSKIQLERLSVVLMFIRLLAL